MSLFAPFHRPPSLRVSSKRLLAKAMIFEPRPQIETRHWSHRSPESGLEDVFIRSLAIASSCSIHARQIPQPTRVCGARNYSTGAKRHVSSTPGSKSQAAAISDTAVSREELKELVNTYGEPVEDAPLPTVIQPRHYPLARRLVINEEESNVQRQAAPAQDEAHRNQLRNFRELVRSEIGTLPVEHLWERYLKLPSPRLRHLPTGIIKRLLRHLSWVRWRKNEEASARYLAVVEACAAENIPLNRAEWNSAISFANSSRLPTVDHVQKALETWMRMQNVGVDPNNVTFNILFDIAVKAGRYALADTIAQEMKSRDMYFSRFFFTMKIYYAGKKLDGDAVRQAFRDFVDADLIVDTTVMNCVLRSLVLAGEPEAAENVFAKMKWLHEQKMGTKGTDDWSVERKREYDMDRTEESMWYQREEQMSTFFGTGFSLEDKKEEMQKQTPIAPNSATYSTLIKYHASATGDFHRIEDLFKEMEAEGIRAHGSIYTSLFRAFVSHGGKRYTLWDVHSLEKLYADFLSAVESHGPLPSDDTREAELDDEWRPRVNFQVVRAILRAFYHCTGYRRTIQVFRELQIPYRGFTAEQMSDIDKLMRRFADEDSMYINKRYIPL